MPLETTPTTLADLDATWPLDGDDIEQGDNHIRNLKNVMKLVFSGAAGNGFAIPIQATEQEINIVDGDTPASAMTPISIDKVVYNDGGTMKQVNLGTLSEYFRQVAEELTNKTLTSPVINNATNNTSTLNTPVINSPTINGTIGGTLGTKLVINEAWYSIGTWNMNVDASKTIAHGLTYAKIISADAIIRADNDNVKYSITGVGLNDTPGDRRGSIAITSTLISLTRANSGFFDSTAYDIMSGDGNRGFVIVRYID